MQYSFWTVRRSGSPTIVQFSKKKGYIRSFVIDIFLAVLKDIYNTYKYFLLRTE